MYKPFTLCVALLLFSLQLKANDCEQAYQDATYAYQHLKTSFKSYNLEHLRFSAEKALVALEKVETATNSCGCAAANDLSYNALDDLRKGLSKEVFEEARIFIQRGKTKAQEIIISLDICGEQSDSLVIQNNSPNLLEQEKQLLAAQKKLQEQQKLLEQQIKAQKQLQAEVTAQKVAKLTEQKQLKSEAEISLKEFETLIKSFANTMGCKKPAETDSSTYLKSEEELESESLIDTKTFYADKAREIANKLVASLESCE